MELSGGCQCGAVRYRVTGEAEHASICHCSDCRKSSGAPMVAWAGYRDEDFAVTQGAPRTINSSGASMRSFCGDCGTGLYYRNSDYLPGQVAVQSATLDDPEAVAPHEHIQLAERLAWMKTAHELPGVERFPEMP